MIKFNIPPVTEGCLEAVSDVISKRKMCGDGEYTAKCRKILKEMTGCCDALLTSSGTDALEAAAILSGAGEGDEVIMPSFTFSSTANAFVLRGAKIVFVDIRPDTMNIDENLIEDAITDKTKAIVPVHYAGVSCEMDTICDIARKHGLTVVEDAAQGVMSQYKGRSLGTIGDFGCYSFHETKNYSMGEGGCLLINNENDVERAEIIREKGTNRNKFFRGQVDKYTWVDCGSSFLPGELGAAYLYPQLVAADKINNDRLRSWELYREMLSPLEEDGKIVLPTIPAECRHNAHMFYIKVRDLEERTSVISYLKENGIGAVFHYVPLHSSPAGERFGRFHGEDRYTTKESDRLIRLPMYYGLESSDVEYVCEKIREYFR